jgi:hypothetical protein
MPLQPQRDKADTSRATILSRETSFDTPIAAMSSEHAGNSQPGAEPGGLWGSGKQAAQSFTAAPLERGRSCVLTAQWVEMPKLSVTQDF